MRPLRSVLRSICQEYDRFGLVHIRSSIRHRRDHGVSGPASKQLLRKATPTTIVEE
jgi:hypothetical protein